MSMQLIETIDLGSTASSVVFTGIPQDGVDLMLLGSVRSDNLLSNMRLNSSTEQYSYMYLQGAGGDISFSSNSTSNFGQIPVQVIGSPQDTYGNFSLHIPNYSGSKIKEFSVDAMTETNTSLVPYQKIILGVWTSTSAITELSFLFDNYQAGSLSLIHI